MSIYLIPPVSYQTQQKLKSHAKERKQRKHSTSRKHSVSSSTASVHTKTSLPQSIEEISNFDTLSISSDKSRKSIFSLSTPTKKKSHTYNYSYNSDINEILKGTKSQHSKRKSSRTSRDSQYTRGSNNSTHSTSTLDQPAVKFTTPQFDQPTDKSQKHSSNDTITSAEPIESRPSNSDHEEIIEQQEEENNELVKVYSNVSSIFSTRGSSSPSDMSSEAAPPSIKTKLKKKFMSNE